MRYLVLSCFLANLSFDMHQDSACVDGPTSILGLRGPDRLTERLYVNASSHTCRKSQTRAPRSLKDTRSTSSACCSASRSEKNVSYLRWQLELTSHHPASTLPQIRTQPLSKTPYLRTFEESRCTSLDVRLEEERGISDPQRDDTVHESNRFAGLCNKLCFMKKSGTGCMGLCVCHHRHLLSCFHSPNYVCANVIVLSQVR